MTTFARIADGTVAELSAPPEGMSIADCFHPDIVAAHNRSHAAIHTSEQSS